MTTSHHVLYEYKVRSGCTVPNLLPETKFVGPCLRMDATQVFFCWKFLSPMGAAGERPEFDIKTPLGAPFLILPQGYLLKSFPQGDTSARQWGYGISPSLS